MVTINGMTNVSLDSVTAIDLQTGAILMYVDELQNASLETTEDTREVVGKQNRLLQNIPTRKSVTASITSALLSGGLMAATQGSSEVASATMQVKRTETHVLTAAEVTAGTFLTRFTGEGTAGAEIGEINILTSNGGIDSKFVQAGSADTTKFAYTPGTKTVALPKANAKLVAGVKLLFIYTIEVDGSKIGVSATKNGITSEILIDGVWQDMCENKYHCTIRIARGRFSSANTIQMGSEQTLQEISINCLPDICSGADDLYEFIVYTE